MDLFPREQTDKKRRDYKFQVVDIEAKDWTKFLVLGFYDGDAYFEYKKLDQFVYDIYYSKKQLNIFAHFGGGYDFLFLIEAFIKNGVHINKLTPRGSSFLSMDVQGHYKIHKFRDSSSILPFSLGKITEAFNVPTKKGTWDHTKTTGYTKELGEYLKSDCLGLYQSLKAYFESDIVKMSGPKSTIASQAQAIMQHYIDKPIPQLGEQANEFCRQAAHGGRTEIFRPVGKNIYEYDINSLYPFVMRENFYPSDRGVFTRRYHRGKLGIYEVRVSAPKMFLPIIGCKIDGKLLFPSGTFSTTCTSVEMEYAKTFGYKFKVTKGIVFRKKEKYFEKFIDAMYALRQTHAKNTVQNVMAKLVMNSSYGRFLIKTDKENLIFGGSVGDTYFRTVTVNRKKYEIYKTPVQLDTFKNAAIGSFILAYARIHMHRKMFPIQDKIYYMDTDSCWTTEKLISSDELGKFKLEKTKSGSEKHDDAIFLLPKTYIATSADFKKIAMKGFSNRKIQGLKIEDFHLALQGDLSIYVPHDSVIAKFKTAAQKGRILMKKSAYVKRIMSHYTKRSIDLKNNITYPLILDN